MQDLFEKIYKNKGPLGKWALQAEGYFVFPKLEGPISNRMYFKGKKVITWSINDYLGLANLKEIRTRISSVSSTMKITSAMKMVSAAKLKKSQDNIEKLRPYAEKLNNLISDLSDGSGDELGPLVEERSDQNILFVVKDINSKIFFSGFFSFICRNLVLI